MERFFHIGIFFCILLSSVFHAQTPTREQRINIERLISKMHDAPNPSEVLALVDRILQIDSSNTIAIAYLAIANGSLGNYPLSLKNCNSLLAKKPNSGFAAHRANLKSIIGDTLGALEDIEIAFSTTGYDPMISNIVVRFLGTDKRIVKYLEEVVKRHPDCFSAHSALGVIKEKQADFKGAYLSYKNAINAIGKNLVTGRYEFRWLFWHKAEFDFLHRRYSEAIDAISQSILLYPEKPFYYKFRIKYYLAAGEQKKACADIQQLQKLDKEYFPDENVRFNYHDKVCELSKDWLAAVEAEKFYIQAYKTNGSDTTAIKTRILFYTKALEAKPDHIYALAGRAFSNGILSESEKALEDWNKVLLINKTSVVAFGNCAQINCDLERFEEALREANRAIELDSGNAESWVGRATIESHLGDTAAAYRDVSRAIKLDAFYSRAYFEKGILDNQYKNNPAAALECYLKAIELKENLPFSASYPSYNHNCASAFNKLGLYNRAIEEIDKAISKRPNNPLYYYRSGEIKARMKDMEGACKDWRIAKQLGYNDADELILYNCQPELNKQPQKKE